MGNNKSKIVIIVGQTASGKSALAIKLADKFNGEIISADSRQVYKGMDIGTGKVKKDRITNYVLSITGEEKTEYYSSGVRHHLIDIANPKKQFTVSDFKKLGEKAIEKILAAKKLPIIAGGTGLYIDALLGRMTIPELPPDKKLRAKLEKLTAGELFGQLLNLDPLRAKTIDRRNKRRLVRALEIVLTTKKSSVFNPQFVIRNSQYDTLWLGIASEKNTLAKKIKKRLDGRLRQGMIKEVRGLLKNGVGHRRLQRFGLEYKWVSLYLKQFPISNFQFPKKPSPKDFKDSDYYDNLLRDIIRYSKRQMTWFKRNKEIHWLAPSKVEGIKNEKEASRLTKSFIYS